MWYRVFLPLVICVSLCVFPVPHSAIGGNALDRVLYIGSSPLYAHLPQIVEFFDVICANSTVRDQSMFARCAIDDSSQVFPNLMIGDNTFLNTTWNPTSHTNDTFIQSIAPYIHADTPGNNQSLTWIDELVSELVSLNTNIWKSEPVFNYTIQPNQTCLDNAATTLPNPVVITPQNISCLVNVSSNTNTTTLIYESLTFVKDNSSNPNLTYSLAYGKAAKLPEWIIIQDTNYLPLYPTYRNKSLAPALHQILTYSPEVFSVLFLPNWADVNITVLQDKGLPYNTTQEMQLAIDDAYHQIETELHTWIDARPYPIKITDHPGGGAIPKTQYKPTLATIPLGPVFAEIINITSWSVPGYWVNYTNETVSGGGEPPQKYNISKPSIVVNATEYPISGVDLLYNGTTGLTVIGEYVVSLLLFSTMYNRSVNGSVIPPYYQSCDVIEYGGAPRQDDKPLRVPYITNHTATIIQQIVDRQVRNTLGIPLIPYVRDETPTTPTPPPTEGPSSSSSSSFSSSSSPSSSSSSSLSSSSSTGVAVIKDNNQSSNDQGIKSYWIGIIAGIVALSILLYCCYRKKQTSKKDRQGGYGRMEFDMDAGYEVELAGD